MLVINIAGWIHIDTMKMIEEIAAQNRYIFTILITKIKQDVDILRQNKKKSKSSFKE